MQFHQQSPLDKSPVLERVIELIRKGEFNTSIANIVSQEFDLTATEASVRRFRKRHALQGPHRAAASYTKIKNDVAEAMTPVQHNISPLNDPDQMLRERGLDPLEWFIDQIGVNEWEGRTAEGDSVTNHQAKFIAKRKKPQALITPVRSEGWKPVRTKVPSPNQKGTQLAVICGDQQAPFHDVGLHDSFCQWLTVNQPHKGVVLGDLIDLPDISRHPDDPDNVASTNECLQAGYDILRDYVAASPNTEWEFLMGNHDQRIKTYILKNANRLYNLSRVRTEKQTEADYVFALEHLMRLDELGVRMVTTNGTYEDAQVTLSPHLAVRHGWLVRTGSGSTALKTLEKTGYSIVVGHVHRQSLIYHTTHDIDRKTTTLVGAEAGCMCRMDGQMDEQGRRFPSYQVLPDWQQGFCVARLFPDGKHHLSLATYVNNVLLWENQQFASRL